jgi:tyrosine-protein kinase Etk/Wzc
MEKKEINILDYFYIIYKARNFIIFNFLIVCLLAAGASMIMPKYFRSTAVLLPPGEQNDAFGFSQMMSALPVNIRLGSQGSPSDIYMGIMKSQSVRGAIVEQFNLKTVYGVENNERAMGTLKGLTKIALSKEGLIEIDVQDRDPKRAADIANAYCATLDSVNRITNQIAAKQRASFIVQQIQQNDGALTEAENDIKKTQLKSKSLPPVSQVQLSATVIAELEMDIMRRKALLEEYKAKSLSNNHPLVQSVIQSIKVKEQQLEDLRFGKDGDVTKSILVPLENMPSVTLEYAKNIRKAEMLGQLESLLQQQYEESKIEQVNNTSTIHVLDYAKPAENKYRPKRAFIVIVAGAASIFFSILSVVIIEFVNRLVDDNQENRRKLESLAKFLHIN